MLAEHETLLRHQFAQVNKGRRGKKRGGNKKPKKNSGSLVAPDSGAEAYELPDSIVSDSDNESVVSYESESDSSVHSPALNDDDRPPRDSLDSGSSVTTEIIPYEMYVRESGEVMDHAVKTNNEDLSDAVQKCDVEDPSVDCIEKAVQKFSTIPSPPTPPAPRKSSVSSKSTIKLQTTKTLRPTPAKPAPEHMLPRSIHDREIFHSIIKNRDLDCAGYAGEYYKYAAQVKAAQKEKLESRTTKSRSGPLVSTSHKIAAP